MNEEKEAIETMQHWIEYEKENKGKIKKADELIEIQETVLNLIEKQQAELETLKRDFEIVDHECSRLEQEDIKKDLLINMLAEQLTTPVHSKEWVINYYKKEIEKGKEE